MTGARPYVPIRETLAGMSPTTDERADRIVTPPRPSGERRHVRVPAERPVLDEVHR